MIFLSKGISCIFRDNVLTVAGSRGYDRQSFLASPLFVSLSMISSIRGWSVRSWELQVSELSSVLSLCPSFRDATRRWPFSTKCRSAMFSCNLKANLKPSDKIVWLRCGQGVSELCTSKAYLSNRPRSPL